MKKYVINLIATLSILPFTYIVTKLFDKLISIFKEKRKTKINKMRRRNKLEVKILKYKQKIQLLEVLIQEADEEN